MNLTVVGATGPKYYKSTKYLSVNIYCNET